jgi:hypothetical protein
MPAKLHVARHLIPPAASAGQVQRSSGAPRVELPVPADRVVRAQALDRDASAFELARHLQIGMQPAVRADPDDQPLR